MSPEPAARGLHVLLMPAYYPSAEQPVAGLFMLDLAGAISLRNTVTVLAPTSAGSPQEEVSAGIRTIRVPLRNGAVNPAHRLVALNATVSRLRREGTPVDVIHGHYFSTGLLAALVGGVRRLPVVVTENLSLSLTGELSRARIRAARFTYRRAARVLPDSPLQERRLRSMQPAGRYEVVPEVVDIDSFAAARRGTHTAPGRHILAVSNLIPRKGLTDLLEAVRLLAADGRDVALTVVGEGEGRPALEAQAEGLPVVFAGARSRAEVVGLLETADVFAMPTLADPFGISPVEAAAAGVPVVVSNAAGCAELIEPLGARVIPPADPRALRRALADALDGRVAFGPGTAEALRSYCSPTAVGERLDSIYRSLVDGATAG
jgi:glycosyltransferase involved in cell wall biosynthesis